jgi:hypothetical protein
MGKECRREFGSARGELLKEEMAAYIVKSSKRHKIHRDLKKTAPVDGG